MTTSPCGEFLDRCTCPRGATAPRAQAELDALHRAAVARAHRSGFAAQPLPTWLFQMLLPSGATSRASSARRAA